MEDLLSSYLKDVGINEEQFVQACGTPSLQSRPQMQVKITGLFTLYIQLLKIVIIMIMNNIYTG